MLNFKFFRNMTIVSMVLVVSGCSTLSQEECLVADWQLIGREDGAEGRGASYIGNHRKACAEYGVVPDLAQYKKGYDEGLVLYCDQYNGFKRGEQGADYNGACPAHLEPRFLIGYNEGRAIYLLKSRISQARSSINANENKMEGLDEDIGELEDRLVVNETTSDARREILAKLKKKQEERGALENENQALAVEAAMLEGELKGMGYGGK